MLCHVTRNGTQADVIVAFEAVMAVLSVVKHGAVMFNLDELVAWESRTCIPNFVLVRLQS